MAHEPVTFSFANNFWGKDDQGVQNLFQQMHFAKQTCEEIHQFFKERVAIEEDYSRKMLALSRKGLGSNEMGTLRQALDVIRTNTESMGKSHAQAAQQVKKQLDDPLESFAASIRARRKTTEITIDKLTKAKSTQNQAVERARTKFEDDCNKINGYYAQQNLLMGKELEKNKVKLDKVYQTVDANKRDYQNSLRVLAETTDRWNKEWKLACDKFQDLEEERIDFLKSNLWAYTNIVSTVCVSDDEGCENIRLALEQCETQKDIEMFVKAKGTGSEIMDPPEFINYLGGFSRDSTPSNYRIAKFSRQGQDTDEEIKKEKETENNYDDGTVSLQPADYDEEEEEDEEQHENEDVPQLQVDNFDHSSVPQLNINKSGSGEVDDDFGSGSMPMLSHPTDNNTAQSSPVQGSISPNSSVYSTNTSISSLSETEQLSQDQPKARTWSSPFRKRSKKDLKKGWNPNKYKNDDQQSTITPKSSLARSFMDEKQQHPAHSPSSRSVLSMGDNMFDLGVTRQQGSKSPFDYRSSSPVKKLSKDDPLVAALERLKVSTNSSSSNESTQGSGKYGPLGGNNATGEVAPRRVLSRSAPVSPVKQKASLVPPRAAFTATEMEATSAKYSAQTKEMFVYHRQEDQRKRTNNMPRPRSQIELRNNSRPQEQQLQQPHLRQNQYHTVRERPNTYYGGGTGMDEGDMMDYNYRSVSPAPSNRMTSPYARSASPAPSGYRRSASPAPQQDYRRSPSPVPSQDYRRSASPAPQQDYRRSPSPAPVDGYGRPISPVPSIEPRRRSQSPHPQLQDSYGQYENIGSQGYYQDMQQQQQHQPPPPMRPRSKSALDLDNPKSLPPVSSDGRKVLRYSRAAYDYRAAIPEEVSFRKGEVLLILTIQDDGWWDCEVLGSRGRFGLAPSNFLVNL